MSDEPVRERRWFPPKRLGHRVQWILLLLTTATLMTNAYYLKFLEPSVSKNKIALVIIFATATWMWGNRFGFPSTLSAFTDSLQRHSTAILLGVILLVAFYLRLSGISYGLPQSYIPDEYDFVHSYLVMLKRGDFNPHWWIHPSFQAYVNVITYLVVFFLSVRTGLWTSIHQLTVEDVLYWGRLGAGVIPGTVTVLATFLLGRRMFGDRVGLMAAALLAVLPGAVEVAQYNKPDPLLTMMAPISVLVTLTYLAKGGRGLALASGIAIGLTVSAKYNGALVGIPFILAVILREKGRFLTTADLYVGIAGTAIGFFVGCPYFFADFPNFVDHVADDIYGYALRGWPGAEGIDNWAYHVRYMVQYGTGLFVFLAGLGGLGLALYRLGARLAVFLAFPIIYYSYYSSQRMNFPGNLISVYPFLAVLAAYAVFEMTKTAAGRLENRFPSRLHIQPVTLVCVMVLLIWFPLRTTVARNHVRNLPDTGAHARQWIDAHIPPGTHVAVERGSPVLDPARYTIKMESRIINRAVRDYRSEGVSYLIVTSMLYERHGPEHRQTQNYQKVFQLCPLVREFRPVEGEVIGPTVRILSVPEE